MSQNITKKNLNSLLPKEKVYQILHHYRKVKRKTNAKK
jgi:hypothetical protein